MILSKITWKLPCSITLKGCCANIRVLWLSNQPLLSYQIAQISADCECYQFWRAMIRCERPLNLTYTFCFELHKAYRERQPHIRSSKSPWIWKNYMEIEQSRWFYHISYVNFVVNHQAVSWLHWALELHLGADYPRKWRNYLNTGLKLTAIATQTTVDYNLIWWLPNDKEYGHEISEWWSE